MVIVAIVAVVMVVAGVVMALFDRPSDDCKQAERAMQPWGATMPDVYRNLPPDITSPTTGNDKQPDYATAAAREAQAAKDIRAAANLVGSSTLRADLYTVADAFQELSRSRLTPTSPSAPSKDYFHATTRMATAIHDIKQACPTIGDGTPVTP